MSTIKAERFEAHCESASKSMDRMLRSLRRCDDELRRFGHTVALMGDALAKVMEEAGIQPCPCCRVVEGIHRWQPMPEFDHQPCEYCDGDGVVIVRKP